MERETPKQSWSVPRHNLERRLDQALARRLTTLVAAPGYGKTTLLEHWTDEVGGVLVTLQASDAQPNRLAARIISALRLRVPDLPGDASLLGRTPLGPSAQVDGASRAAALATALAEAVAAALRRHLVLALDRVEVIADAPDAGRFIETLVRSVPASLHVVLASRIALPFPIQRLRRQHEVLELDATDLALSRDETVEWCRRRLGAEGQTTARQLRRATGGWPALVHAMLDTLPRAGGPAWSRAGDTDPSQSFRELIVTEFEALPAPTRQLLRAATVLPHVDDGIADASGADAGALDALLSRGLFLNSSADGCHLTDISRQALLGHRPLAPDAAADVAATAVGWYVERGRIDLALQTAMATDRDATVAALLEAHGDALLERPELLVSAIEALPEARRQTPALQRIAGIAHHNRGDWQRARSLLTDVADGPAFDATVAWRLGFIEHLRGDLDAALISYTRGAGLAAPEADAAMCAAMAATVHWMRGDRDGCAVLADEAMERARALGDPRALAASHTVVAMLAAMDGDRRANDAHYLRALHHAEQASDTIQQIRIRSNRASHHQEEGAYVEALAELAIAERLAEASGFGWFLALALSNRAEVLMRLGRLEEAAADAGEAADQWERLGSRLIVYALNHRAHLQMLRGELDAAERTYRRAVAEAESAGEVHGLVPALAGLADLLMVDDPLAADQLAERALRHSSGLTAVTARLAAARLALAGGRRQQAKDLLDEATRLADARRDRPGVAAAAELRAALEADPVLAQQAIDRWEAVGDPIGQASAQLVLAHLTEPDLARPMAQAVQARMQRIGCRCLDDRIAAVLAMSPLRPHAVQIGTMGTFRVQREGVVVPRSAWQSRKARDLLKILVAHRGRPVPREQVAELLWPDARDAGGALKRLNVQVSTLRTILDPGRDLSPDHLVVSADGALRLDLDHVSVDVERFLGRVVTATRLEREGRGSEALEIWRAAESTYAGDFLAEDPYAEWSVTLREEARLAYAQAARRLAAAERAVGRHESAARYWLRLLEIDPFDEPAHMALVDSLAAAGRHGDARRRYRVYSERMRQIAVEPASYPNHDVPAHR